MHEQGRCFSPAHFDHLQDQLLPGDLFCFSSKSEVAAQHSARLTGSCRTAYIRHCNARQSHMIFKWSQESELKEQQGVDLPRGSDMDASATLGFVRLFLSHVDWMRLKKNYERFWLIWDWNPSNHTQSTWIENKTNKPLLVSFVVWGGCLVYRD
jgi:hypothetical protein